MMYNTPTIMNLLETGINFCEKHMDKGYCDKYLPIFKRYFEDIQNYVSKVTELENRWNIELGGPVNVYTEAVTQYQRYVHHILAETQYPDMNVYFTNWNNILDLDLSITWLINGINTYRDRLNFATEAIQNLTTVHTRLVNEIIPREELWTAWQKAMVTRDMTIMNAYTDCRRFIRVMDTDMGPENPEVRVFNLTFFGNFPVKEVYLLNPVQTIQK